VTPPDGSDISKTGGRKEGVNALVENQRGVAGGRSPQGYLGWEPETALGGRSGDDGPWPPAEASLPTGDLVLVLLWQSTAVTIVNERYLIRSLRLKRWEGQDSVAAFF